MHFDSPLEDLTAFAYTEDDFEHSAFEDQQEYIDMNSLLQ